MTVDCHGVWVKILVGRLPTHVLQFFQELNIDHCGHRDVHQSAFFDSELFQHLSINHQLITINYTTVK